MAEEPKVKLEVEIPASQLKDAKINEISKPEDKKDESKKEPTIAGYKPEQLLSAPVEKPEPADKRSPNVHQKRVIILGLLIVLVGLLLGSILGLIVAVSIAAVGAFIIVVSVFVRI